MSAFIYAMRRASDGAVKLDLSISPDLRLAAIRTEHGDCELLLSREVPSNLVAKIERTAHQFAVDRMVRGEWFRFESAEEAGALINRAADFVISGGKIDCSEATRKRARIGRGIQGDSNEWRRGITPMSKAQLTAIDDFRFGERMPSRNHAIRSLIELGIAAWRAGKAAP